VLCAFAAELYLKCLLCIETGDASSAHNLKALFRDLNHTTRNRIETLWNERLPAVDIIRKRVEHLGTIEAANAEEAIKIAAKEFDIPPERQNRITVEKVSKSKD
jgi:HEPN domain-containing protein